VAPSEQVEQQVSSRRAVEAHALLRDAGVIDPDERAVREGAQRAARAIAPHAATMDASGEFSWDVVRILRENSIFGIDVVEEFGGTGEGPFALLLAIEEIAKVCATSALVVSLQQLGSLPIKLAGSEAQRRRWLPYIASGEWLCAYALTEREAGSDPAALATTAHRDGDEYVLNGSKYFISNAGIASLYTVFARTAEKTGAAGISAFVVPAKTPGFSVGRIVRKMGLRAQPTGELLLHDCRIPAENLLGQEGDGFRLAMRVLDRSRPGIAAQALGLASGATAYALEYAQRRHTFGKPIIEHQLVAGTLADMATRCQAARSLLYECGRALKREDVDRELTLLSSMAKLFCSDVAMEVTVAAVQVLGGYGYTDEHPLERMVRDAKVTQIYEGTNEIQRLIITRQLSDQVQEGRTANRSGGMVACADASESLSELIGPARARIVRALDEPRTTGELALELGVAASTASQHLKGLSAAGVVSRSRRGRRVLYALTMRGRELVEVMSKPAGRE
jgi:alkylation response protein AidB-like acyl-CoA dehydrogenase/DNA-binding transcriptional ArsR family regulator